MEFQTAFGEHRVSNFNTSGPSLTHQSEAPQCDINTIMLKYQKTGIITHENRYQGQYGDFTNTPTDYHESMNAVLEAQDMFDSLPSSVRKRFHNDPASFLDFVGNPDNQDEMVRLGLSKARPAPSEVLEDPTPPKKAKATPEPKNEPPKGE